MREANQVSVIELGNAAFFNSGSINTLIFESGAVYKKYGLNSDVKVKRVGDGRATDFDHCDEYYFQKIYTYIGHVKIVKEKRSLRLEQRINNI
jgi:hypothetical protein